ncbi:MAK10-like protein [Tanacetum coccineum]
MPNPKNITDPTTAMNMALVLIAKAFKLNYSTPANKNQRISSNPRNRQIAQPGMNMGQDRQMQMVGGNGGNQFRQYAGQNVRNQNGYNAVQNVRNQNPNMNGNVVAAQAKGNANRNSEAGIQLQAEEFELMAATADLDEIEEVNAKCILMANDEVTYSNLATEGYRTSPSMTTKVGTTALPQDVPSTSDHRLIELKTQVQRLMEAHLAPTQPTHVNKITTSYEICSGPHDTQYCMEDPEQAVIEYASSHTDEAGGLVSEFMASQDARLSKFEADFKQQQSEMTNKIDTVLKAITDRIAGTLPSDTVKNPKQGTTPAHFKEATISQTSMQQPEIKTEPPQPEEPEPTLEDEFQDLHLNLPVLEVLAHTLIYNAILDKYVESLELGKNISSFIQGEIPAKMVDPRLFTLPCRLGDSKPLDTLVDLGSCVNIILLYLFKKLNIGLVEETDHIFGLADGTKSYFVGIVKDVEVHIGKLKLLNDFYVIDINKDPETPLLIGRRFLATANTVIDCRMAKIAIREGSTRHKHPKTEMEHGTPRLDSSAQLERSLPKPYSQSPPLGSSSKEKVQERSSTWTTSTTLNV